MELFISGDFGAYVDKAVVSTVTCSKHQGPDSKCICFGRSEKRDTRSDTHQENSLSRCFTH